MITNGNPLIQFPKISDPRGSLTFIEEMEQVPFAIKRIYYLYDIPLNSNRGAHGHKKLQQMIVPLSGSFIMTFDDGRRINDYQLDNPSVGLLIPPLVWHELKAFTEGTVCLVLASEKYDESDYFRDYKEFLNAVKGDI